MKILIDFNENGVPIALFNQYGQSLSFNEVDVLIDEAWHVMSVRTLDGTDLDWADIEDGAFCNACEQWTDEPYAGWDGQGHFCPECAQAYPEPEIP